MSLAQFADASFGYPGNEILTGASLLIRPGRSPGAARTRTAPGSRRRCGCWPAICSPTAATCGCWGAPASRTCASRRSCRAAGRSWTRCSSRSPTCSACTTSSPRSRRASATGDPARSRPLRRAAGALPARGRLRARVAGQAPDRGRRVRRGRPRPRRSTRCRAASAGRLELAKVLVRQPDLLLHGRADEPPGPGRDRAPRGVPGRVPGRVRAGVARSRVHPRGLPGDRRARERQVRPLPVRLRQVRRRARGAPRAGAGRVRAPEGARRQDRGLHPPQPGRAEDQAGAEPAQDAGEAGAPRAARRPLGARGEDRPRVPDGRRPRRQGDDPRARASPSAIRARPILARRHGQHLPRRQGRHRRAQRQRQVDAAQDADRRAARRSAGKVETGTGVRIGYFDQKLASLDEELSLDGRDPLGARRPVTRGRPPVPGQVSLLRRRSRSARCAGCRAASAAGWRWRR